MRKCQGCGATFRPGSRERNRRKWCSEACRVANFRKCHPADLPRLAEAARLNRLRRELGLTADGYDAMCLAQGGVCALCGREERKRGGKLAVDHDHGTGEIRGLLCATCNTALGRLGDSVDSIERVLAYLTDPPACQVLDGDASYRVA